MKTRVHLQKAARFERAFSELDTLADLELAIWAAMHIGTNYLNAALHRLGVTVENDAYPSDRAGNYFTPDGQGGWEELAGPPGDVIHTNAPPLATRPAELAAAYAALARIEAMRPRFVRGNEPFGPGDAEQLRADLEIVRENCIRAGGLR